MLTLSKFHKKILSRTQNSFHKENDLEIIKFNLLKNAYPLSLINQVIKKYLDRKFSSRFFNEIRNTEVSIGIADDLKTFLVSKFTCANCGSSYIDEICCHFKTGIEEHIKNQRSFSSIFIF